MLIFKKKNKNYPCSNFKVALTTLINIYALTLSIILYLHKNGVHE